MRPTSPSSSTSRLPVLVAGIGPLPPMLPDRLYAPGIRLWGFTLALLKAGFPVRVMEVRFGEGRGQDASVHGVTMRHGGDSALPEVDLETEDLHGESLVGILRGYLGEVSCRAVVATTDLVNAACAQACGDTPLWCDFFGHPMTERQGLAHRYESDEGIHGQWDDQLPALLRADHFSTCSGAQRLALIGELGACGRLNRHTDGIGLVSAMTTGWARDTRPRAGRSALRGSLVPDDAFVVLWAGGYNTWADTQTLAAGLLAAMRRNPRIRFVSTGGAIEGHDNRTFDEFRRTVEASDLRERFHFAGWVPMEALGDYYALADVAVICDRPTLEGELGSRTRVLEWLCAGIPTVCTDLCELTHEFSEREMIATFRPQDAEGMAQRILDFAATSPGERADAAERGRAFVLETHAPDRSYAALARWAAAPNRAPDLRPSGDRRIPFAHPDNALARRRAHEWLQSQHSPQRGLIQRLLGRISGDPKRP